MAAILEMAFSEAFASMKQPEFWLKFVWNMFLTLKHRETHGCVVSTVVTDALVLKHQAISIHNAD